MSKIISNETPSTSSDTTVDSLNQIDWVAKGKQVRESTDARTAQRRKEEFDARWIDRLHVKADSCRDFVGKTIPECMGAFADNLHEFLTYLPNERGVPQISGRGLMRAFSSAAVKIIQSGIPNWRTAITDIADKMLADYFPPDPDPLRPDTWVNHTYDEGDDFNYLRDGNPNLWDELAMSIGIDIRHPRLDSEPSRHDKYIRLMLEDMGWVKTVKIDVLHKAAKRVLGVEKCPCSRRTMERALKQSGLQLVGPSYDTCAAAAAIVFYVLDRSARRPRRRATPVKP